MNDETAFLCGLMELSYGQDVVDKLKPLSQKVSWAQGWPQDVKAFWNAEAFMWQYKIDKEKRELIGRELAFLEGGRNLDVGCGAYSYISSVGYDVSEKMLLFNERCTEKVIGDLECALPFEDGSFDSATAVFVLNYVLNYKLLLSELRRVLRSRGCLMMVLYGKMLNDWQRQKEVNHFLADEWVRIACECGFQVDFYEKEDIWFFKGIKEEFA